jgi:hypothetical protein
MRRVAAASLAVLVLVALIAGCAEGLHGKPAVRPATRNRPVAVAGTYVLHRRLMSCTASGGCAANPMDIRIACASTCTVTRTNAGGFGLGPWTQPLALSAEDGTWRASGPERNASECHDRPAPTTAALVLKITEGAPVGRVWQARQFAGVYTATQGPTSCDHGGSLTGVYAVTTGPVTGNWLSNPAVREAELVAKVVWDITEVARSICGFVRCKYPPAVARVVPILDLVETLQAITPVYDLVGDVLSTENELTVARADHWSAQRQQRLTAELTDDYSKLRDMLFAPTSPLSLMMPPAAS